MLSRLSVHKLHLDGLPRQIEVQRVPRLIISHLISGNEVVNLLQNRLFRKTQTGVLSMGQAVWLHAAATVGVAEACDHSG